MAGEIANGHGYLGYIVFVALLGIVVWAALKARDGSAYSDGLPRLAGLLFALQWVYGILVYVQIEAWNGDWPLAMLHPLAMTAAVALVGISTARAGRADDPATAWGAIARFQGLALVLVVIGIGSASM